MPVHKQAVTKLCDNLEIKTREVPHLHLFLQIYELLMQFMERSRSLRLVAMLTHNDLLLIKQVGQKSQDAEHVITLAYVLQTRASVPHAIMVWKYLPCSPKW